MDKIIEFFKDNVKVIITGLAVLVVLIFTFTWDGFTPKISNTKSALQSPDPLNKSGMIVEVKPASAPTVTEKNKQSLMPTATALPNKVNATASPVKKSAVASKSVQKPTTAPDKNIKEASKNEQNETSDNTSDKIYEPVNPEDAVITDKKITCTFTVRCDTALNNTDRLDKSKLSILPVDGVILPEQTIEFNEGESVFAVLRREMKRNDIQFEFVNTPIYNSSYIEGINNLYEFDCGELSGWMYKVNGWFPNYSCARYILQQDDVVEILYTCDLGKDIGGDYASGKQQ